MKTWVIAFGILASLSVFANTGVSPKSTELKVEKETQTVEFRGTVGSSDKGSEGKGSEGGSGKSN